MPYLKRRVEVRALSEEPALLPWFGLRFPQVRLRLLHPAADPLDPMADICCTHWSGTGMVPHAGTEAGGLRSPPWVHVRQHGAGEELRLCMYEAVDSVPWRRVQQRVLAGVLRLLVLHTARRYQRHDRRAVDRLLGIG